ncbi:MAG: hypothetical protein AAFX81_00905 [Pseudomonadota bacterium]
MMDPTLAAADEPLDVLDTAAPSTADDVSTVVEAEASAPADPELSGRPDSIPEKFWDQEAAEVRTDALLKSYLELERRMSRMLPSPEDATPEEVARLQRALGVPEAADDYAIETTTEVLTADPEVNQQLHAAGFTQAQAQLVYKLAEDYLLPAVSEAYGEVFVEQELHKLESAFGGAETWQATAAQLRTWGKANLDTDVYATLSASADGVMAMNAMMQAREPVVVQADDRPTIGDEQSLRRMMQDPRYWRERDPAFVAEVTRGFERLFRD